VSGAVPAFLEARRSIRAFRPDPVDGDRLDALVAAAALAPAPHHTRPWRFAVLTDAAARAALAAGMGEAWRRDLAADAVAVPRIDALVDASRRRLAAAPAAILACLTDEGLDRYPDEARQRAEWGMAVLSLGAAVENLMLAAADAGLASCWVAAPIFCPNAARASLRLDDAWVPQALILVGHADPGYRARTRPPIEVDALRVLR
jgi:F420 biosynthesis protein FbiB-like protein